jgi:hypothetical protein
VLIRPWDLAERIAGVHQPETIRLPIDAARYKAREIIISCRKAASCPSLRIGDNFPTVRSSSQSGTCQPRTERHGA